MHVGRAGFLCTQILTKLGVLNVPEWYDAGKVSAEQTGIGLGEQESATWQPQL